MFRLLFILAALLAIVLSLLGTSYIQNRNAISDWRSSGYSPGQLITVMNERIFSRTSGEGTPGVLILPGFGASIVEWWPLQDRLSQTHFVLSLDKPGYSLGTDFENGYEKFPQLIRETLALYPQVQKWVVLAHSSSAYLAKDLLGAGLPILGVIFVDPLVDPQTVLNEPPSEWFDVFINARPRLERSLSFAQIGLFRFLNSTPYDVPNEIRPFVLNNLAAEQTVRAMIREYNWIFRGPIQFNKQDVPVLVYHHNPDRNVQLITDFSAPDAVAHQYEQAWENSSRRFLDLYPNANWVVAKKALFSPHIEAPEELAQIIESFTREAGK